MFSCVVNRLTTQNHRSDRERRAYVELICIRCCVYHRNIRSRFYRKRVNAVITPNDHGASTRHTYTSIYLYIHTHTYTYYMSCFSISITTRYFHFRSGRRIISFLHVVSRNSRAPIGFALINISSKDNKLTARNHIAIRMHTYAMRSGWASRRWCLRVCMCECVFVVRPLNQEIYLSQRFCYNLPKKTRFDYQYTSIYT